MRSLYDAAIDALAGDRESVVVVAIERDLHDRIQAGDDAAAILTRDDGRKLRILPGGAAVGRAQWAHEVVELDG